jgi:hypothetical protein
MLKPDKELINFWLGYAESHLLWHDPEKFLIHGFLPPNAMGVPQKEAYENHILGMKEGNRASHSCYSGSSRFNSTHDKVRRMRRRNLATGGVANLIQLTTGRANEPSSVVGLGILLRITTR